ATGAAMTLVAVRLSNPSDSQVIVDYTTADETAGAPVDYSARSGHLYFAPGETVKTVYAPVNSDNLPEGPEQFSVRVAGATYVGATGTLTIPARATSGVISIPVIGDSLNEADETFSLTLGTPIGATVTRGTARATITDDDPLPALSIDDGAVVEPLAGTKSLR